MTPFIKKILATQNLIVCPSCLGEGEIDYFCGHMSTTKCINCGGNGVVESLKKKKKVENSG